MPSFELGIRTKQEGGIRLNPFLFIRRRRFNNGLLESQRCIQLFIMLSHHGNVWKGYLLLRRYITG